MVYNIAMNNRFKRRGISTQIFNSYPTPKAYDEAMKKDKEMDHRRAHYERELRYFEDKIKDKRLYPNRDILWRNLIHLCVRMFNDECYSDFEKQIVELAKKLIASF